MQLLKWTVLVLVLAASEARRIKGVGKIPPLLPQRDKTEHFPIQPELPMKQQLFILVSEANNTQEQMLINGDIPGLPLGN